MHLASGLAERGLRHVFWQSADGSTPPERLTSETALQQEFPSSFSPDGSLLLVNVIDYAAISLSHTGWDIFVLPLSGERTLRPFLQTKFNEAQARFSPDGRWVAYVSDESGRLEVFVRPFPGPGRKVADLDRRRGERALVPQRPRALLPEWRTR